MSDAKTDTTFDVVVDRQAAEQREIGERKADRRGANRERQRRRRSAPTCPDCACSMRNAVFRSLESSNHIGLLLGYVSVLAASG